MFLTSITLTLARSRAAANRRERNHLHGELDKATRDVARHGELGAQMQEAVKGLGIKGDQQQAAHRVEHSFDVGQLIATHPQVVQPIVAPSPTVPGAADRAQ